MVRASTQTRRQTSSCLKRSTAMTTKWSITSAKEYVRGDVHTNSIESFWSQVKRGINGTYVWVSKKHLQLYLREFEYRHNLRRQPALMFELLLQAFPKVRVE